MKNILLLFIFIGIWGLSQGQTELQRLYEYDDAGNRVVRKVFTLPPAKSAPASNQEQNPNDEDIYYTDNVGNIQVQVYPNPTSQYVTIQISNYAELQKGNVWLYNLSGQLLKHIQITGDQFILDLSSYPSGNYIVKLSMNEYHNEWKIIKQ